MLAIGMGGTTWTSGCQMSSNMPPETMSHEPSSQALRCCGLEAEALMRLT
jgi:hypothetical protein